MNQVVWRVTIVLYDEKKESHIMSYNMSFEFWFNYSFVFGKYKYKFNSNDHFRCHQILIDHGVYVLRITVLVLRDYAFKLQIN